MEVLPDGGDAPPRASGTLIALGIAPFNREAHPVPCAGAAAYGTPRTEQESDRSVTLMYTYHLEHSWN